MLRTKASFAIYWLLFAALAFSAAKNPGFVHHPELVSFPVVSLLIVWVSLALCVTAFYFVLRPPLFRTSSWRLPSALAFAAALLVLSFGFAGYTDLPGLYYVPFYFASFTMLILVVVAFTTIGRHLFNRARREP